MSIEQDYRLIASIRNSARTIKGESADYDALMESIGDARFVLLGEASHGTHQFYHERARITRRLIEEKGFHAVALEADWPDTYRINRYVRGNSGDKNANQTLSGFERFPSWMWRNQDFMTFVELLKRHNDQKRSSREKVGVYGLDLYSLFRSIEAVITYLEQVDPEAAKRAHYRYSCFEHFGEDPQTYGYAANFNLQKSCEEEVVKQLQDLQQHAAEYLRRDGRLPEDAYFFAEQNARVIQDSEAYYRAMFKGRNLSWNLRDTHMAETLEHLVEYLEGQLGQPAKVVVWAHNSHIGDARATELGETGEINIGQLVRQRYGDDAYLVGFSTNTGTVTAADNWDEPERMKRVVPALSGSYEGLLHDAGLKNATLILRNASPELIEGLQTPRLERAIGVIYHPETERISHYYYANLLRQFDAVIHMDQTQAVQPLDPSEHWDRAELPETYPYGI